MWWLLAPERLSVVARLSISNADAAWVSAVSLYEIDIKRQDERVRGRDGILSQMPANMPLTLPGFGLQLAEVTPEDAWQAANLPLHHRDPWDRILVAQARRLGVALVTRDKDISAYDVRVDW